jgi:hypothetical protein
MNKSVKLSTPIAVAGKQVSEVTVRYPVLAGDWRAAGRGTNGDAEERMFQLVARMTGLDVKEIEQMTMHDFQELTTALDMGDPDPKAPSSPST